MITIGLVKELLFIVKTLKTPVFTLIKCDEFKYPLDISIGSNKLLLSYKSLSIWCETLGDNNMFGIESCDHIYKIMKLIDSGDTTEWLKLRYFDA